MTNEYDKYGQAGRNIFRRFGSLPESNTQNRVEEFIQHHKTHLTNIIEPEERSKVFI